MLPLKVCARAAEEKIVTRRAKLTKNKRTEAVVGILIRFLLLRLFSGELVDHIT